MYKVKNLRKGAIGCSCDHKGEKDVLMLSPGDNEVANDLWESILKGNPERYEAMEKAGQLSWRKMESKSRKKAEPKDPEPSQDQ